MSAATAKPNAPTGPVSLLAAVAALGVSYFGVTMLILSLLDTDYSPISQAASDYGVGRFATEMNVGFFIGGVGMIAFALAISRQGKGRNSKTGSALLLVAGLVLIMDSYFTTNVEGGPSTLHGTIHGFGGLIFFITAPIGVLLVCRKFSRRRFLTTLVALLVGFVILLANLNAGGLAERIILLVIFSSVITISLSLPKNQPPSDGEATEGFDTSYPHVRQRDSGSYLDSNEFQYRPLMSIIDSDSVPATDRKETRRPKSWGRCNVSGPWSSPKRQRVATSTR